MNRIARAMKLIVQFRTYLAVGEAEGAADGLDDGLLVGDELGSSDG